MGRPLYTSILLARHAAEVAAQPAPPKPTYPVVEKWSRWNAFDPDSDEFMNSAVDERFLSDEEIAGHAQVQHRENEQLLAERLLREANAIPPRAPSSMGLGHSVVGNDATDAHISVGGQMESIDDDMSDAGAPSPGGVRQTQEGRPPEGETSRRQPHRAPVITEWRLSSTGEVSYNIPSISVIPAGSRDVERASSNIVSGLQHLSDSPGPFIPADAPPRPISPIPNTPARVSGVFGTPPTSGQTLNTSSPASTVTPRVLTWAPPPMPFTPQWVPESATPQDTTHFLGSLAPAPLTF